jgi:hypothetical protein
LIEVDRDTRTLWYVAIAMPLVVGLGFYQVMGVPLWVGVPVAFLVIDGGGWWLYRKWEEAIERDDMPAAELDDPVFGRIELRRNKDSWKGEVRFAPVSQEIMLSVSAGPGGPSEAQRELYRQIEARYRELLPKMHALLAAEATSLIEVHQETTTANDYAFELAGIEIEETLNKWIAHYTANALGKRGEELSEQSWGVDAVTNMSYFVFVENWEPQGVCLVD